MNRFTIGAIALSFATSWGLALIYYLLGGRISSPYFMVFCLFYMWMPGLVGLYLARREGIALPLWKRPNRYWLYAALLPLALVVASILLSLPLAPWKGASGLAALLPAGAQASLPPQPVLLLVLLLQTLLAGATLNAVFALGEELMWRGYLWERMRGLGLWRASLWIGPVWGLWHAPLILQGYNYPQHPLLGVVWMMGFCLLLTPWMLYLRDRGGSILVAAIFHGVINGSGNQFVLIERNNDLVVGLLGWVGFAVLLLANLGLYGGQARRPN